MPTDELSTESPSKRQNMILARKLSWDSIFFGISVGSVEISSDEAISVDAVKDEIDRLACELTYVHVPVSTDQDFPIERVRNLLVDFGGRCYDLKTFYVKPKDRFLRQCIDLERADKMTERLRCLACSSGWCSRFAQDPRLDPLRERMYAIWLENEFRDGMVLVYPNLDNPSGLVTLSVREGSGRIGLVSVDAECCRKGIGTHLMEGVDQILLAAGAHECRVVTQGLNVAARRLYESVGFDLVKQVEVWHVWRKR